MNKFTHTYQEAKSGPATVEVLRHGEGSDWYVSFEQDKADKAPRFVYWVIPGATEKTALELGKKIFAEKSGMPAADRSWKLIADTQSRESYRPALTDAQEDDIIYGRKVITDDDLATLPDNDALRELKWAILKWAIQNNSKTLNAKQKASLAMIDAQL